MANKVLENWIKALRSGDYKQGKNFLRTGDTYCCLGVLCDLFIKDQADKGCSWVIDEERIVHPFLDGEYGDEFSEFPSKKVSEWLDDYRINEEELAKMNDIGKSFDEISSYLEEYLDNPPE